MKKRKKNRRPTRRVATTRPRRARPFRLPADVRPHEYRLDLTVDPQAGTFGGAATIDLALARPRRSIELHAADLRIEGAEWHAGGDARASAQRARVIRHPERETVELALPAVAPAGPGTLVLRFSAKLQAGLRGLYGARADGQAYAFTQLEAADARRFFPCFDEPSFKARFRLSVTTDAAHAVLSNTPVAAVEPCDGGRKIVRFAPTPKLSTYLCALAVGPLEGSAPVHVGRTPIRVWHVPGKGRLTATAVEAAAESLARLERYFDLPYPYEKLDLVAVPDFEAGAMENVGAVFFRETLLLADPATMTLAEHKRLAEVIAHELAHMWYGNLVTMAWWNDLWLNEAFATWMAFRIVDEWKPEWRMWNNFEHHRAGALSLDALTHTHPIYAEVHDVSEATENFDAITYEKGAAVVRMVEHYLGPDTFREGVRLYIRRHREGNTVAADLWRALEETSGKRVERVVRPWIEHAGFPLLTVRGEPAGGRTAFAVRQERFFASPRVPAARRRGRWPIPWVLKYRRADAAAPAVARHLVERARDRVDLDTGGPLAWYYGNADEGGFFRVRHAETDLAALTHALSHGLTPVERMGLLSHQWALVRSAGATIETFLDLADGFGAECDHDVLDGLAAPLDFIEDQLLDAAGTTTRPAFAAWLEHRFGAQLAALGWDPAPGESDDTRLRRAAVVRLLGEIAAVPDVAAAVAARLARYLDDRTSLEANLADSVVLIAARDGDATRFERYRAAVRTAGTPQERRRFLLALGEFRAPALVARALDLTLTDEVPTQDVASMLIRLLGNPAARAAAWTFIRRRWARLRRRLPPMMIARVIEATPALQTAAMKRDVAAFFRAHPVPTAKRALRQALERFDLNAELRRRAAPGLAGWLARRPAPGAADQAGGTAPRDRGDRAVRASRSSA